jgi:glycerol-1-phosphate dehydrogenase [NAD(P)+]
VVYQRGVVELIQKIRDMYGTSFILVSHDMGLHYQATDRIAIMYAGKIVETGRTEDVFKKPLHPYSEGLINSIPRRAPGEACKHNYFSCRHAIHQPLTGVRRLTELDGIRLGSSFSCDCGREHLVSMREVVVLDSIKNEAGILTAEVLEGEQVLIVTGYKTRRILGEQVYQRLLEYGCRVVLRVVEKCDLATCSALEQDARGCRLAVAVGGGSVIDSCKLAAHRAEVPFVSIPTTISHDGIASPVASVFIGGGRRASIIASPPLRVILATDVVRSSPSRHISAGCGDILAKVTSLQDWILGAKVKSEYFCRRTFELVRSAVKDVRSFIDGGGVDLYPLILAAVKCGLSMSMMNSSRPCSGAEHLFSHYIDHLNNGVGMHGEQVGIGAILMARRYEEVGPPHVGGLEIGSEKLRGYVKRAGAPTTLSQIGISAEAALKALLECTKIRPERYTILHHAPLTKTSAEELLRQTEVLDKQQQRRPRDGFIT